MKRDFLKGLDLGNGAKLPDEAVEAIMTEYGKEHSRLQNTIDSLTTERNGLQTQLSEANTTIQSYKDMDIEGIKQSAANWETKYNTDTQALRDQLEQTKYGHAVEQAVAGLKFSSESARKAFLADLTGKKLTLENGRLLGLEDFTKDYKEADPGAFAPETTPPTFTLGGTGTGSTSSGAQNPFHFSFTGVRTATTNGGN